MRSLRLRSGQAFSALQRGGYPARDDRGTLKPPRVGGEVDGEPALRAFTTDRLGDFAADGVDSGDVVEPHAGRNRNVDFDELRTPDLGDVARIGLEAVAGDDRVHDASDMGVELGRRDQQYLAQ